VRGLFNTASQFCGDASGDTFVNSEPTPDRFAVNITYSGPDGTPYEGQFPLDVALIRAHSYATPPTAPEQRKEIIK